MALVIPVGGAELLLDILLKQPLSEGPTDFYLALYTNDYSPDRTSVFEDFTEATFTNYSRAVLERSQWQAVGSDDEDRATTTYGENPLVFEMGDPPEPTTCYGHFVIEPTTNTICWAERWDTPRTLTVAGDKIEINLPFYFTFDGNPP